MQIFCILKGPDFIENEIDFRAQNYEINDKLPMPWYASQVFFTPFQKNKAARH